MNSIEFIPSRINTLGRNILAVAHVLISNLAHDLPLSQYIHGDVHVIFPIAQQFDMNRIANYC